MRTFTVLALAGALIPLASASSGGVFRFRKVDDPTSVDIASRDVFSFRKSETTAPDVKACQNRPSSSSYSSGNPPPPTPSDYSRDVSGDCYGNDSDDCGEDYGDGYGEDSGDDDGDYYGDDYGDNDDDDDVEYDSTLELYLGDVCFPELDEVQWEEAYMSGDWSLLAPCVAYSGIDSACTVNGTSKLDNIAEKECLCNGGFFEALKGCNACLEVHGDISNYDWYPEASLDTLKSDYCNAQNTEEFYDLVDGTLFTGVDYGTTASDLYPSQTAVSYYFTATKPLAVGAITGSATAATFAAVTRTNSAGSAAYIDGTYIISPVGSASSSMATSIASTTGPSTASPADSSANAGSTGTTASAAAATASAGAAAERKVSGLMAVVLLGAGLVL